MAKKNDLKSVTADLAGLAASMPTQRPPAALAVVPLPAPAPAKTERAKTAPAAAAEPDVQLCFHVRQSQRKELQRLAAAAGHDTVRSFVLDALRAKGLTVTDSDLVDRRRKA